MANGNSLQKSYDEIADFLARFTDGYRDDDVSVIFESYGNAYKCKEILKQFYLFVSIKPYFDDEIFIGYIISADNHN